MCSTFHMSTRVLTAAVHDSGWRLLPGFNQLRSGRVERERAKSSWADGLTSGISDLHMTRTDKRMIQKKPSQLQMKATTVDSTPIPTTSISKKQQGRQKHKPSISSVKYNDDHTFQLKKERREKREGSRSREEQSRRERRGQQHKTGGLSTGRSKGWHPGQETGQLGVQGEAEGEVGKRGGVELSVGDEDVDTDLSDSERLPTSSLSSFPPPLNLRPEILDSQHLQPDHTCSRLTYPDFLPPPFNSWSLQQLALFLHPEERHTHRSRAAGLQLDRYLDRLLQMELLQILSIQEESGNVSPVPTSRCSSHSEAHSRHSRLSSPKCILQCQRAFPLALLSSLSPSARLSDSLVPPGTGTFHSHTRHIFPPASHHGPSRLSPLLERLDRVSLPKRSCSESRVRSIEKILAVERQRCVSPSRGTGHLKRMQAFGNIRNAASPVRRHRASSAVRDPSLGSGSGTGSDAWETARGRTGSGLTQALSGPSSGVRTRRSESERRRAFGEVAGTEAGSGIGLGVEAWGRAMERAVFGTRTVRGLHWTGSGSRTGSWAWTGSRSEPGKRLGCEGAGEKVRKKVGNRGGAKERG
uniref:Uncharacterized protein n=2 Tax=Esox lucius TaxID=8010 RepID=A0A3P8YC23_ESOLU